MVENLTLPINVVKYQRSILFKLSRLNWTDVLRIVWSKHMMAIPISNNLCHMRWEMRYKKSEYASGEHNPWHYRQNRTSHKGMSASNRTFRITYARRAGHRYYTTFSGLSKITKHGRIFCSLQFSMPCPLPWNTPSTITTTQVMLNFVTKKKNIASNKWTWVKQTLALSLLLLVQKRLYQCVSTVETIGKQQKRLLSLMA